VLTILFLKNAGIGDKFVQQREEDQERAFQKAFTIDLGLAVGCVVIAAVALPLFALAYGRSQLIAPGLVLSLAIVGNSLQAPVWIHYREMNFGQQRLLLAIDPCLSFVVTITLALTGAGVWALVIGATAGAWAGGIVALVLSPYRPKLAFDRGTARDYFDFSWPLVVANGSGMVIAQGAILAATRVIGLAGAGGIGVAESVSAFSDGVDGIVTQTLYPAICRIVDRADLLYESFVKSNRLALMWGMPFGLGVALFAPELVHFVIGDKWRFAVDTVRAFGLVAAFDQIGFNWTAYLRALGETKYLALLGVVNVVVFLVITLPLLIAFGINGFALGWLAIGTATLASRAYCLRRVFPNFRMSRQALRAITPCLPAIGAVLAVRAATPNSVTSAIAELVAYLAIVAAASVTYERALLREVLGYLGPARTPGAA
jgi:O-antigen/teichoic acid export membrane protein